MKLKYESEVLPEYLKNKKYRCELHCYDQSISYEVLDLSQGDEVLRIRASRMNSETEELYPAKQVFFVGEDLGVLQTLNDIIEFNKISSVWVDSAHSVDWESYYDIEVSRASDHDTLIKYHQTVK